MRDNLYYRLIVLTHGRSETLQATLDSFYEHVSPAPIDGFMVCDGCSPPLSWPYRYTIPSPRAGFCGACRIGWYEAAWPDVDFVFWLEHDFTFERDVQLYDVADVLDADPMLAQMALMRDAVNEQEKAAGGLYESRAGEYEMRWGNPTPGDEWAPQWLEHRSYFTTNPSLMRREFMAENPWPTYPSECEGRFGIDLLERGYSFGVWGDGEPWVAHAGVRTGFGY